MPDSSLRRFSSRRERIDRSFLSARLLGARSYDRIAGYFNSSLLEVVGEELESVTGPIRIVCNSDLNPLDIQTARAAQMAIWRSWTSGKPEAILDNAMGSPSEGLARRRFQRLFDLLKCEKLQVKVLPDEAFGLIHGKAGVITLADGSKTSFIGSANESWTAWKLNYELIWEDPSPESVAWVQEEFDALWYSHQAIPLAEAIVQDIERISKRRIIHTIGDWLGHPENEGRPDPASATVESPVYRKEVGLWEHQKYFVRLVFDAHCGPTGKARFVLADQVGLGKTVQLALAAQLIALTGYRPILVICPKTLLFQWQTEMRDLLDMPSAVWDGQRWVDELGVEYPAIGPEGIRKCPRRVGIVSSGLISHGSETAQQLLRTQFDCVILDEAHRARRHNLGENRDEENPDPNNLLSFMYSISERTRSLLLATATPVQLRPIEAWDLLDVLSRGDDSVLGNPHSRWRTDPVGGLNMLMGRADLPKDDVNQWEWFCNPLPPKKEHRDFEILRRRLYLTDDQSVVPGSRFVDLREPERRRLQTGFERFVQEYNPFIRRIIRRTRHQLENQLDPDSGEPLLKPIKVELFGEEDQDAVRMTPYLRDAYELAEEFCQELGSRPKGSGFLKTLLLRRVSSTIHAGLKTAERLLADWGNAQSELSTEEDEPEVEMDPTTTAETMRTGNSFTNKEHSLLERFITALRATVEWDPKYAVVLNCLKDKGWLELGCIIFSQYYESIAWLGDQLTKEFPQEPIGIYSGPDRSGLLLDGQWTPKKREAIKELVQNGQIRLLLGTDAAAEGLNLQRLACLINLDLPWNPTKLEQRKGRIQRIGQVHETIRIYNLRYQDSVEDRVHQLLSHRLQNIYQLFGQIPDVLEAAWVALALGEKEKAQRIIDDIPKSHPFEIKYAQVEKVDWESCSHVLSADEKRRVLSEGWN